MVESHDAPDLDEPDGPQETTHLIDEDAIADEYYPLVLRIAKARMPKYMQGKFDPEDIAQETFAGVIQFLRKRKHIRDMQGLIVKITNFTINNYMVRFRCRVRDMSREFPFDDVESEMYADWKKPDLNDPWDIEPLDMQSYMDLLRVFVLMEDVDREIFKLFLDGVPRTHIGGQLGYTENMPRYRIEKIWRPIISSTPELKHMKLMFG